MFVLQHALTKGVIRRRAPLDASVAAAAADALEEGDWLTIRTDTGRFEPVADTAPVDRLAWPIVIEPSQPDAVEAGMVVVHGSYFAQTDRFAAVPLFTGFAGADVPNARVAPVYAKGGGLVAFGFEAAAGGAGAGPLISGLATALTSGAEDGSIVAYVERIPSDNNNVLQLVVF